MYSESGATVKERGKGSEAKVRTERKETEDEKQLHRRKKRKKPTEKDKLQGNLRCSSLAKIHVPSRDAKCCGSVSLQIIVAFVFRRSSVNF